MFETISDAVERIFSEHQLALQSNYPGLNKEIFKREVFSFLGEGFESSLLVNSATESKLRDFESHVIRGVPFQYISGLAHFYGREFLVGPGVLIPRQETEILVEQALNTMRKYTNNVRVLDLCAGSGCIGITLVCEAQSKISSLTLSDNSVEALRFLKTNVDKFEYSFSKKLSFSIVESDLLNEINGCFEFIVSNPPYIKSNEHKSLVHSQVLNFEPHQALFIEDNEYDKFFDKMFFQVRSALVENGVFIMEGHENELEGLSKKWNAFYPQDSVEIINDLTNRPRFIKVIKDQDNG